MKYLILLILLPLLANCQILVNNNYYTSRIIFEGNSLSNYGLGPVLNGYYIPLYVYNNVYSIKPLVFNSFAISGQNQTQINDSIAKKIAPIIHHGDYIVLWEGTNDMYTNGLTGAQAFNNMLTYANYVVSRGVKLIVCTVIARDYALDPADLMDTRIPAYNTLVRDSAAKYGYNVCDLAASTLFDARADASNGTYYNADKIHITQRGSDSVAVLIKRKLITIL